MPGSCVTDPTYGVFITQEYGKLRGNFCCFVDVDECARNNGGCQHLCHNIPGSYYCSCFSGYVLQPDRHSCACKYKTYFFEKKFIYTKISHL